MKCLILAGGMSSRMKKSNSDTLDSERIEKANSIAKGLLPIGKEQKPFMLYLMENMFKAGISEFVILLNEKDSSSKAILDTFDPKFDIEIVIQSIPEYRTKPYGTADAVLQAMQQNSHLKNNPFIVCNSDNLYSKDVFTALIDSNYKNAMIAYDRAALSFPNEKISAFALCKFDVNYRLESIVEKPDFNHVDSFKDEKNKLRVSMNIFKFNGPDFFSYFESCPVSKDRDEKEIPTAIMSFIHDGNRFYGIPFSEHVPDLTTKDDILRIENEVRST